VVGGVRFLFKYVNFVENIGMVIIVDVSWCFGWLMIFCVKVCRGLLI